MDWGEQVMKDVDKNIAYKNMAFDGICGAVIYGIADMFLYLGTDIFSKDPTALWHVAPWRLMTSMGIGVIGSFFMIVGFFSLYRLYIEAFGKVGRALIIPSFLCIGGVLFMHFTLGVYAPLTYQSALKAGVSDQVAISLIQNADAYLSPFTFVLVILGYFTEIVIIAGVLSGKFGLQKRTLLFMYGVYAVAFGVFLLIGKLTGEWGLTGSLESLFETTFFIPAYLYWKQNGNTRCDKVKE